MRILPEILREVLAFSTQVTLAQLSTVNHQFHSIIKHFFANFPLHNLRPVDVKKNLSCTLGIGSIRLNIKEAIKIFRPKFVRSPMVYLYLPTEETEAEKYINWFQSVTHLWSDQLLIIYLTGPITANLQKRLFTNFASSAKELTVENYCRNCSIDLFYPDLSICPTVWICGNIKLDPLQIIEHLNRCDKQMRLSLNIFNQRQIEDLVNAIQKDFNGSTRAHPFFLKAEYYLRVINAPSYTETQLFNETTMEFLQIHQTYCGFGLIELECLRGF